MTPAAMTPDAEAALARAGLSRRAFLKSSGALIVGFSVAGTRYAEQQMRILDSER